MVSPVGVLSLVNNRTRSGGIFLARANAVPMVPHSLVFRCLVETRLNFHHVADEGPVSLEDTTACQGTVENCVKGPHNFI